MDETPESDDLLGFLAQDGRQRRDPEDHPSVEKLTAYQANELTPEEDSRIQDHLLICRHCTDMLLDLEEFLRPAEPAAVADFQAAASWQKLRGELPVPASEEPALPAAREGRLVRPRRTYGALAAVLGAIVAGQLFYEIHLHRKLGRFHAFPEHTVDLTVKRGMPGEPPEDIHPPVALSFQAGDEHDRYRVDFLQDKLLVRSIEVPLPHGPAAGFSLPLENQLSPGLYEVRVFGWRDGETSEIGAPLTFRVQS